MKHTIVIALAGWCFIGKQKPHSEKGEITLTDASVIRVWGTTKGVGEIALNGAQQDTILDPCGEVSIPPASQVAVLKCNW